MKLYLAHPMSGLSGNEIFAYYDNIFKRFKNQYQILSPVTGKDWLRNEKETKPNGYQNEISTNHAIFQRDTWMVSQSDIVFCDLTGSERISIGCCMELAIASWLNKHTIVVMDKDNLHNHAFILESADIIYDNLADGLNYLSALSETMI